MRTRSNLTLGNCSKSLLIFMRIEDTLGYPSACTARQLQTHDECSICLEPNSPDSSLSIGKCGHLYHRQCLDRLHWRICPMCRRMSSMFPFLREPQLRRLLRAQCREIDRWVHMTAARSMRTVRLLVGLPSDYGSTWPGIKAVLRGANLWRRKDEIGYATRCAFLRGVFE